jgi:PAS domain S-box-containing protein
MPPLQPIQTRPPGQKGGADFDPSRHMAVNDETYRQLFEHMAEGVAYCQMLVEDGCALDWIYLSVNRAFERLTGLKGVVGRRISEVIPGLRDTAQELFETFARVARGGECEKFEWFVESLLEWYSVSAYSPQDGYFVAIFDIITERKLVEDRLAAALEFHRRPLNEAPILIWRAGTDAKCYWFNATWLGFTGRTLEQELGDGWVEGVHAEDLSRCLKIYLEAFAERRSFDMDYRLRRPDGAYSWISDFGIPFHDLSGEFCGYIGYCFDISGRKSLEGELRASIAAANAATRAKTEFLSIMSHELRTPLNGVLGFSELLSYSTLNEEQHDYVRTIIESGEHLLAVVNDILEFSSMEKSALAIQVEPLKVADLIKGSMDTIRKTADDKGLALRCEVADGIPEHIIGDGRRIRQVLINLLGNAVKFTARGSVVLRVATTFNCGRWFLDFRCEDTGIGISPETISRLFEPFVQGELQTKRQFGGTGLGLAISGRIAKAMDGSITIDSALGIGSTFTFQLPLDASPSASPDTPVHGTLGPAPPAAALVLVVDDDPPSSAIAGKMLQGLGYRVQFAANGVAALKAFVPGKFAAILMDLAMPVMDGLETTGKIRELEAVTAGRVAIIAFTANVMSGDRERCLAAGMDEYLSKPCKMSDLAARLACVLDGQH